MTVWIAAPPFATPAALNRLKQVTSGTGGCLLTALLIVVMGAAGFRRLGVSGLTGTEELSIWLFVCLVFLGLASATTGPLAMRLDLVTDRLSEKHRMMAGTVADGLAVLAILVIISGGLSVIDRIGGTSTALGLPEWVRFAPVPVGGGLALISLGLEAAGDGRGWRRSLATLAIGVGLFAFSHAGVLAPLPLPSVIAGLVAYGGLAIGTPLPHALIAGLAMALPFGARLPEAAVIQNTVAGMGKFLLLAIPFFLLTGILMNIAGLAHRLVALAFALVGHRRGGLAQTALLTNLMFAGVSGSSVADAAFGAKVLAPAIEKAGVPRERAVGIVAATAILPNIVPPSIAFLILAIASNLSVGALFTGGLFAGLFLALLLAVTLHWMARADRPGPRASTPQRAGAFLRALPALGLALVIFGGIRLALVTPTEAAGLAALYAIIATVVSSEHRGLGPALAQAAKESASIGLLIGASGPFVFLLAVDHLPQAVASLMTGLGNNPFAVMAMANVILLIAGCFIDIGAAILLLAPLLLPSAIASGMDPVQFGVVLVVNLMIGGLTPPVGMLVYVAAGVAGLPSAAIFRAAAPLTLALVAGLAILSVIVATGLI